MSRTIEEAIYQIQDHILDLYIGDAEHNRVREALNMAIAALQEKLERENPKPLTLEELRQLNAGEVIWHKSLQGLSSNWCVLRHDDINIFKTELTAARYGKTWIAYRHKPKEDEQVKPKTNADRIRAMNDDELADFMNKEHDYCKNLPKCEDMLDTKKLIPDHWCEKCLLDWLQKPVEEPPPPVRFYMDKQESGLLED